MTVRARLRTPAAVALACGAAGVAYRLVLLLAEVPATNSDEATMGLAALHIATGRGYPIFFYGQYYMGTVEAYLAAPLFALFGPSTVLLRLPLVLLYAAFLYLMWRLTVRLFTPWLAAATVGLLALGADRVVKDQLIAGGGYPEVVPAAALLMLLAVSLGLPGVVGPRLLGFAAWGFVAGLMLWDHWLIVPYLLAALGVLVAFCWRELAGRAGIVLVGAGLLGALPLVVHNVVAIPRNTSLQVFLQLQHAGSDAALGDRLYGAVILGVPLATGVCGPSRCAPWQLWWGVALPILLVAAGVLAFLQLRPRLDQDRPKVRDIVGFGARGGGYVSDIELIATGRVREGGRLALVVAAVLSVIVYAQSPAAADTPIESARYLSCLLVSAPAALWPLWTMATRIGARSARASVGVSARASLGASAVAAVGALVGVALVATALVATVALARDAPATARRAAIDRQLVAALREGGLTRIYSDYWTCNRITFAAREDVICAVLDDELRPGLDRYGQYRRIVAQEERPAYLASAGSDLDRRLSAVLGRGVPVTTIDGYRIYRPAQRIALPAS